MAFAPAPDPVSPLARYRLLSPNAAVRVSPLCLGAMNLGTAWAKMMGALDKEESFKLLDYFYEQGGNFIDVPGTNWSVFDNRRPMYIKMNRANCGSVNGWQREETAMRLSWPRSTHPDIKIVGKSILFMSTMPAIRQRVFTYLSRTV
jgi:hypothetical protein